MAQTKLGDYEVNTIGDLPSVGSRAPEFILTGNDLRKVESKSFSRKRRVLNIFASVDADFDSALKAL